MENIIDQLRRGSAFQAMAQQFSQSASASTGGDIGWVERGQIEDEVLQLLDQMQNNRATAPIRTATGFYVYLLRDRRVLAAPAPDDAIVSLAQLILPLEPNASEAEASSQIELAETVRETVSDCADLKRVTGELGLPGAIRRQSCGSAISILRFARSSSGSKPTRSANPSAATRASC